MPLTESSLKNFNRPTKSVLSCSEMLRKLAIANGSYFKKLSLMKEIISKLYIPVEASYVVLSLSIIKRKLIKLIEHKKMEATLKNSI